jgi:hypothetical protein
MFQRLRLAFFAVGVVALASTGACSYAVKAQAVAGVDKFHQQLNDAQFDDIWNGADDAFRQDALRVAGSKRPYDATMDQLRHKLGRVVTSSTQKWSVKTADSLSTVTLVQDTRFERGSAIENFIFLVRGAVAKLRDYEFTSPQYATQ